MTHFVMKRLFIAIPVLFGITIFNFFIINLAPGNPAEMYINPSLSQGDIDMRMESMGLNDPFWVQYFRWLLAIIQFDFGYSLASYQPVIEVVAERIGPTLLLMFASLIIAYSIAIPIGVISAVKQYSWMDYFFTSFSFLGVSIPNFFLGIMGIFVFALTFQILPTGGMYSLGSNQGFGELLKHIILPASVLGTAIAGNMVRYVRSSILEVLGQDYLRTARAKGLHEWVVIVKHALRNGLIPIITIIGLDIPVLFGGAVITEQVFQWPGMGQLMIQSIGSRDYSTLMALNLLIAVVVLSVNTITDMLYAVVDPRIKYN
ncbi:ABC transporter permease [Alkalihalobacillus trypoxylicola]|uniref:Peptide permease n=1 Tax=Alkalihalobacillus trypoxylicola TaxID=519424 RepID=A0A161QIZ7_9BACI|nr:ABC transporter permease [Alkalihalobacillus trypoxylicola]KYG29528.1 peptide permease [Alkalihalobacillus trypoxylicola]